MITYIFYRHGVRLTMEYPTLEDAIAAAIAGFDEGTEAYDSLVDEETGRVVMDRNRLRATIFHRLGIRPC